MLDDEEVFRGLFSDVCSKCKHHDRDVKAPWKCKAFDKIPEDIWFGKNKHNSPVKGDKGIMFEAIEKK